MEVNDDYDSDNDLADNDENVKVQLGVIHTVDNSINEPLSSSQILFRSKRWSQWDGGKIGGDAIWLNPQHYPNKNDLTCSQCKNEMIFLLQIYCPLDDITNAFHRCLYLFLCKNPKCVLNGNVKCFRIQLPRENDYYSYDDDDGTDESNEISNNKLSDDRSDNIELIPCQICR